MPILLKESVLKILKNIAPNLYEHRFNKELILRIVSDYMSDKQSKEVYNFIKESTNYDQDW
jgi:hypothetical protein